MDEYDDDEQEDQQPQRTRNGGDGWRKKLEADNEQLRAQNAAGAAAIRELAFVKAGVDINDPRAEYFVKGYDGDLTADAIKAKAETIGLFAAPAASNTDPNAESIQRMHEATSTSGRGVPSVNWAQKIYEATTPEEVKQLAEQAAAAGAKLSFE